MFFEDIVKLHRDEAYQEGYDDAYEEAAENKAIETALQMLNDDMPAETVVRYTSLSIEKVMDLKEELAVKA